MVTGFSSENIIKYIRINIYFIRLFRILKRIYYNGCLIYLKDLIVFYIILIDFIRYHNKTTRNN